MPFYQGKKEFTDRLLGPPVVWTNVTTKQAEAGDILMSVRAPVGPINEATQRICIGRGLAAIRANSGLDRGYLWYALRWLQPTIKGSAGAVFESINKKGIESLKLPLPPLEEQKRIVAMLDEAFEGLDRARANAEANLQDARELFENALHSAVVSDREKYGEVSVAELAAEVTDGDHMPPPKVDMGVPFVTISNIRKDVGDIDFSNTFFVPESYYNSLKEKRRPRKGDVLYTVTGATLGIPVLIVDDRKFCFQRHIGLVRPLSSTDGCWLYYMLMSPAAFDQATRGATGAAQKTVSLKTLRNMRVPNVPTDKQIVRRNSLEKLRQLSINLTVESTKKLRDLDDLHQSFLRKAFTGELT